MDAKAIQVPVLLDKITTLKDGSFKVIFETQELNSTEGGFLLAMRNRPGWLTFSPNQTTAAELPDAEAPEFKSDKSSSQRLRATLFVLWKQQYGGTGDFELFYRQQMERFIDKVKEKLT